LVLDISQGLTVSRKKNPNSGCCSCFDDSSQGLVVWIEDGKWKFGVIYMGG